MATSQETTKPKEHGGRRAAPSPYVGWCKQAAAHRSPPREVLFETAGRAPVNAPPHPARLTPVRQMARTAPIGGFGNFADTPRDLPRSFSGECCRILADQASISTFDAYQAYKSCELFRACSPGFLQELAQLGGSVAWQGRIFKCGSLIYTEGEKGSSMFVIARGTVALSASAAGAISPCVLGQGDCFGVAEGLGVVSKRQETATAKTSVHILEVTLSALTLLLCIRRNSEDMLISNTGSGWCSARLGQRRAPPAHVFHKERRHFEKESRRLYIRFRQKRSPRRLLAPTNDEPPQETSDASPLTTAMSEDFGLKSPRAAKSTASTAFPASPRKRPKELDETGSFSPATTTTSNWTSKTHPRKWREQVERKQAEMEGGNFQDGGKAREQFLQQLNMSIRQDFFNGFQQSPESPYKPGMGGAGQAGGPEVHELSSTPQLDDRDDEEEEDAGASGGMLELGLLPAFSDMSSKQKLGLLRHMQEQNKMYPRKIFSKPIDQGSTPRAR
eukprot:TRINITY_DN72905_c0_g1_i1.p1 TRINITY_DN72905_c0_g1~~TRINITY_DN72905_c0_g1_i1.p1  ORF type:complete len:503 (-),score=85.88 TRINITY_DN72905_c0_g1_i1:452-1960(-)